jgi:hypothetical protein
MSNINKVTAKAIASHTSVGLVNDRARLRDLVDGETDGALDSWKLDMLTDWVMQELRYKKLKAGGKA